MRDNITAVYEKANNDVVNEINCEAKQLTNKLKIDDRVEITAQKNAYVTVKDHKPQFPNQIKCRLINPTKSNIGIISKQLLDRVNNDVRQKLKLRQLKNTNDALQWFTNLKNKGRLQFMQLDIVDFYPSISEALFLETIAFAEQHTHISDLDKQILLHARKSLLYHNGQAWTKKTGLFDVTMGAFDGAQITDLVGLYILQKLATDMPRISFGLYRDDGLGVHGRITPSDMNKIKKDLHKLFNTLGLKITLDTHLSKVDFLDVTLDLHSEQFKPYRKPNDTPLYIHKQSNHPKHIINNLPAAINKRLAQISSTEEIFNQSKPDYEQALRNSELPSSLQYPEPNQPNDEPNNNKKKRKNRNRRVIWYNPPFNLSVTTKFGKEFIKLIKKHFPTNNPLSKIFNTRTIKISFSCTENIEATISAHNRKILEPKLQPTMSNCNCREKTKCPIPDRCNTKCVIYEAKIKNANYIGMTEGPFKTRYNNHTHSFREETKRNSTTLSQYIWDEGLGSNPNIEWKILKTCKTYQPGNRACDLCVSEKQFIIQNINNSQNINKRNDTGNKCVHTRAHLLCNQ